MRNAIDRAKFENGTFAKQEKNIRCAAYGFAVKKTALCKMWKKIKPSDQPIRKKIG